MKKKLLIILLIILIVIGAWGGGLFCFRRKVRKSEAKRSIDEIVASSVDVAEITTNLKSDNIIRLAIKLETDSDKSKKSLKNVIFK